ncbi:hypothetical protein [Endozoicomonas numazuensis]|uniref:Uncharacterized protein n=1 Tax=Endozoicomonas numazuensis TaxID=1137799 RepID=A0A081NDP8_9GAMM|nr:hypothetical protein [Endozoicomonas numazuensis]KEQ16571.1 hypothetical protein GZ78_22320 [Endozoicomonas numazuensis]
MNLFKSFYFALLAIFFFSCQSLNADVYTKRSSTPYSYDNGQVYGPWQGGKDLGEISFSLSEPVIETARSSFITGLKLLHAFEYPEARAAFRNAQHLQQDHNGQDFVMAIWGELMCSYQILWFTRDFDAGDSTLARLNEAKNNATETFSTSERILITAAQKLFSNADNSRSKPPFESGSNVQLFYQYLDQQVTDNDQLESEILVFRSLAHLATRQSVRDYPLEISVINEMSALLERTELANHPGLHHYLTHASESPHLARTMPAAQKSAFWLQSLNESGKNTSSVHLSHMPTHYYFARGDWVNVYAINQSAWNKSLRRATDLRLSDSSLAFHEHLWRVYALLQAGLYDEAWSDSSDLYQRISNLQAKSGTTDADTRVMRTYLAFEQTYLMLELPQESAHLRTLSQQATSDNQMSGWGKTAFYFMKSWNALTQQQYAVAETFRNQLQQLLTDTSLHLSPMNSDAIPIMVEQLKAEELRHKQDLSGALRTVLAVESQYLNMHWDHGVPLVVKPLLEYIGELYMEMGRSGVTYQPVQASGTEPTAAVVIISEEYNRAVDYFQRELTEFFPRRRKSLQGLKEAAILANNQPVYLLAMSQLSSLNEEQIHYLMPTPSTTPTSDAAMIQSGTLWQILLLNFVALMLYLPI